MHPAKQISLILFTSVTLQAGAQMHDSPVEGALPPPPLEQPAEEAIEHTHMDGTTHEHAHSDTNRNNSIIQSSGTTYETAPQPSVTGWQWFAAIGAALLIGGLIFRGWRLDKGPEEHSDSPSGDNKTATGESSHS